MNEFETLSITQSESPFRDKSAESTPSRAVRTLIGVSRLPRGQKTPPPTLPAKFERQNNGFLGANLLQGLSPLWNEYSKLDFSRRFVIQAMLEKWNMVEHVFTVPDMVSMAKKPLEVLEGHIKSVLEFGSVEQEQKRRRQTKSMAACSDVRFLLYKATVKKDGTLKLTGPFIEQEGTALQRAFGSDSILVVRFEDLFGSLEARSIYERNMVQGIYVGLRRYRFYGRKDPSNSSSKKKLKDSLQSAMNFFFVATESWSSADLASKKFCEYSNMKYARSRLAHFHTTESIAKYDSRTQLAISKTIHLKVDLADCKIETIPDIDCLDQAGNVVLDKTGKKALIHTDGCGFISPDLAEKCPVNIFRGRKLLTHAPSTENECPLLLQVRIFWQGNLWKGVLCVNHTLPPKTIQVRPSMLKVKMEPDREVSRELPEPYSGVEICSTSRKPAPEAKLFHHLIVLLVLGGVPEDILISFARKALLDTQQLTKNRRTANRILMNHSESEAWETVREAQTMLWSGFLEEPYLQMCLWNLVKLQFEDIRQARVPVPDTFHLMGCADPTGTLERHQVAVILGDGPLFSSSVLVYKAPGLHPGDIHRFEATYNAHFQPFIDTARFAIFFSTKGSRSVVDEMANSDLDGDLYWVCNNREIVSTFRVSEPWLPAEAELKGRAELKQAVPRFLSDSLLEDHLRRLVFASRFEPSNAKGVAATNWLCHMDRLLHDLALKRQLAEIDSWLIPPAVYSLIDLFYAALDASKSGEHVAVPRALKAAMCPHFLATDTDPKLGLPVSEKSHYSSVSVLGKIFDLVSEINPNPNLDWYPGSGVTWKMDEDLTVEGYQQYFDQWQKSYKERQSLIAVSLRTISDEGERSLAVTKIDLKYIQEMYGKPQPISDPCLYTEKMMASASALYAAVYHANGVSDGRLGADRTWRLGMVWKVAGPILCYLKCRKGQDHIMVSKQAMMEILS